MAFRPMSHSRISVVLYASYVDPKYGEGRSSGHISVDTEWKYLTEERQIVILRKQLPDSPLCCLMGRSVINLPMRQVAEFISTPESTYTWDKLLTQIRVLEVLSESSTHKDAIVYMSHEAKRCFFRTKRDFVFYYRYTEKDGKCLRTIVSVDDTFHPHRPGHVRGLIKPGSGWVLEPYRGDQSRTLISFLAHLDLVDIHPAITNMVVSRYPLQIHHIRKHLMSQTPPTFECSLPRQQSCLLPNSEPYEDPLPVRKFKGQRSFRRSKSLTYDVGSVVPLGQNDDKEEIAQDHRPWAQLEAIHDPCQGRGPLTCDHSTSTTVDGEGLSAQKDLEPMEMPITDVQIERYQH